MQSLIEDDRSQAPAPEQPPRSHYYAGDEARRPYRVDNEREGLLDVSTLT